MGIYRTDFLGNPNVGLFGYTNEKYCLLGNHLPVVEAEKVAEALSVKVHQMRLCGTELVGVFCVGNKNAIVVPEIVFEHELEILNKIGIKPVVIETEFTALGNNVLVNDTGCMVSPEFSDDAIKQMESALKVPIVKGTIGGLHNVGALALQNRKVCVVSPDANAEEREIIENVLGVECIEGTANMGMPYLRAAVLLNKKGMIVGNASSGVEIANIDNAFFIE